MTTSLLNSVHACTFTKQKDFLTPYLSAATSSNCLPSFLACCSHLSYAFSNHDNPPSPAPVRPCSPLVVGLISGSPVPPSFQYGLSSLTFCPGYSMQASHNQSHMNRNKSSNKATIPHTDHITRNQQ